MSIGFWIKEIFDDRQWPLNWVNVGSKCRPCVAFPHESGSGNAALKYWIPGQARNDNQRKNTFDAVPKRWDLFLWRALFRLRRAEGDFNFVVIYIFGFQFFLHTGTIDNDGCFPINRAFVFTEGVLSSCSTDLFDTNFREVDFAQT